MLQFYNYILIWLVCHSIQHYPRRLCFWYDVSHRSKTNPLLLDAFWCEHVIATVLLLTDCTVILSVVALVFDLYLRLFWRIQLSQIQAIMISIFSWIFSGFAVSWQYFIDPAGHKEIMTLQSGNLICLIDFTNKSRQTIAALCLILGLVLSIIVFVGMVYTRVFLFYVTANRKQYMTNVRVPLGNNEKTLLFRSSIVFGSILLFWFPFLTKIVAEISTGEPVSSEYDCFCCLSFSFLNLSNLFMTFLHSASIRKKMYSVFRMAKKHQDKIEKMITEGALSAIQQEPYQPPHLNHVSAASSEGLELNNSELRELPSLSYRSFMFRCSPPSPGGEDVSVGISPTLQLTP